ncbi:MAG: hypothetical protein ACRDMZ_00920 [Solirubrobacteraceae bacterium]
MSRQLISRAALGGCIVFALAAHAQPALAAAAAQPAPDPSQPTPTAPDGAQPTTDGAQPTTDGAQPAASTLPASADARDDEIGDQAVAAELGLAGGGRVTPGGLRIAGHYLYQLSERDWFDGTATFTFGSGQAACFRDRMDARVCSHGIGDGVEVEVAASIRRVFAPQGAFRPFARAGLGLGLVQFGDDDVSGVALTLHGGGGVRVKVAPAIAVLAEGDLALGLGSFSNGVGGEPQLGLAVTAGVEFRLR